MSDFVPLQFEDVGKMRVELEKLRAEVKRLRELVEEAAWLLDDFGYKANASGLRRALEGK
jgi:hypothetical protein